MAAKRDYSKFGKFEMAVRRAFYNAMQANAPDGGYSTIKNCGQFTTRKRIEGDLYIVDIIDNPQSLANPRDNIWRIVDKGAKASKPAFVGRGKNKKAIKRVRFWTTDPNTGKPALAHYKVDRASKTRDWFYMKPRKAPAWVLSSRTNDKETYVGTSSLSGLDPSVRVQHYYNNPPQEGRRFMVKVFDHMTAELKMTYPFVQKKGALYYHRGYDYWDSKSDK